MMSYLAAIVSLVSTIFSFIPPSNASSFETLEAGIIDIEDKVDHQFQTVDIEESLEDTLETEYVEKHQ